MAQTILIAGAGYVGSRAAELLIAAGHKVYVLRRKPKVPAGAEWIGADLLAPETLKNLPDCQHIVYCAAADQSGEEAYERIYVNGLRNLLEAYRKQGLTPHAIFTSSTSVYSEASGDWVDEAHGILVDKGPSRFMVAAERYLQNGPWQSTILRFGGIYGPQRTYFLQRVWHRQEKMWLGAPLYSNRIHREDCARLIRFAIEDARALSQVWNAVDHEPAERNEVIRWMAEKLKVETQDLATTNDFSEIAHRGNKRISNQKLLAAGFTFLYPTYKEGYAELFAEVRGA